MYKIDSLAVFLFILMMGSLFSFTLQSMASAEQRKTQGKAEQSSETKPNRALLDSLGSYPGTTLIREYVLKNVVRRQYATDLPLDEAPTAVTVFYQRKLSAQGWRTLQEHAAVSCYVKGNKAVWILRDGPSDPGLPPGARLLKGATPPASTKFFFAIETGPRPSDT